MEEYIQKLAIKNWAEEDRPRERLLLQGRRALSDAELIAILIGSGSREESAVELSRRILHSMDNNLGRLGQFSVKELSRFKGIGEAKAVTIVAALELGRRRADGDLQEVVQVRGSVDSYNLLKSYFADLSHEEFWIVLLNRANNVLGKELISKGGQAGTIADPKIIFKTALDYKAASIILAHNHPSGNLRPSQPDVQLTKKLVEGGRLLDMPVLDHLIFAGSGYYSFADEGIL